MRVLIEATWWTEGPVSNRQVLREIIFAWIKFFPNDEIHLAVPAHVRDIVRSELSDNVSVHATRLRQHALVCLLEMPVIAKRVKPDVVFSQNFSSLFGMRSTVFLHDVLFESNPEWFSIRERLYFRVMSLSLRRAQHVVTSSRSESARIDSFHNGIQSHAVGLAPGTELTESVAKIPNFAAGLVGFHLAVGRLNIRKNLAYAIDVAIDSGYASKSSPLIIVGNFHGGASEKELVNRYIESHLVIFTGFLPTEELVWLYQNAISLFFLTRGEGFGLPAVEALYFGCPLIVSEIEVMREVTGGYGIFLPLDDKLNALRVLNDVKSDSLIANTLDGRQFVKDHYSWKQIVNGIRTVVNSGTNLS